MDRSSLDVKGWVSGLYLVLAPGLSFIGGLGLYLGLREYSAAGRVTGMAWVNLILGLGLPVGVLWFWRTLRQVRADIRSQEKPEVETHD